MSEEFRFELATPEDEPALRRLLARNSIPGSIEIAYCREPNYFIGCEVMGDQYQVGVCRIQSGEPVGIAMLSSRMMYVNGEVQRIGYLSQLRLEKSYWGRGLTRRGFSYGKTVHEANPAYGYITTIIELNKKARSILETPRDPFPHYKDIGRLCSLALVLRPITLKPNLPNGMKIERGAEAGEIVAFLNERGIRRQFQNYYAVEDFSNGRLYGFDLADCFVVRCEGRIIGTLAYWNQASFKQSIVMGYHQGMQIIKPFYNRYLVWRGARPLPTPGEKIDHVYAIFAAVENDNPAIFVALLAEVFQLAYQRGHAYLMLGLMEQDPLLNAAKAYPHISYRSRLYTVTWEKDGAFHDKLDRRIPQLEIACL
jgi:hypothetical protein